MADYPTLSFVDISQFSGRSVDEYDPTYSGTALAQATLLFKVATCLTALPDDEVNYELAKAAILAMAEQFVLSQPYAKTVASPFSSETIGSYSYSKAAQHIAAGQDTGVLWFDLAVSRLGVCDEVDNAFGYGGIEIMEHDATYIKGQGGGGNIRYVPEEDVISQGLPHSHGPYDVF